VQPGLQDIRSSALWHLYDLESDPASFVLRRIEEEHYRAASFLDQRIEAICPEAYRYDMRHFQELFPADCAEHQAHFIFHLGHCGSTLLSRVLAATAAVLPVREPLTLRVLAGVIDIDQEALDVVLRGLARRFDAQQRAVVKATSTCNRLILPILASRRETRAVLMFVPLESYLAGMLGKQPPARDLLGHLPARMRDWSTIEGTGTLDRASLESSPAHQAVLAWITSLHLMLEAASREPGRCLLLNFEDFLDEPEARISQVADFLGFGGDAGVMHENWSRISGDYSKLPGHPYTAADRERALRRGRLACAQDIRTGLDWAKQLATDQPALSPCRAFFGVNGCPDAY
jgi:hypothetical protein